MDDQVWTESELSNQEHYVIISLTNLFLCLCSIASLGQ